MPEWKKNIHSSQRQIRKRFYKRDDQADRRMELTMERFRTEAVDDHAKPSSTVNYI